MFLYRSVAKMSERAGVLVQDTTGFWDPPQAPPRARSATDLYKNCSVASFSTLFAPGYEADQWARHEEALVWAGHVSTQKMAVFDSYSSRSGEIFFNEIYKSSKQINSQKTSQSILFMCRAKFGTNQLKSMKIPSMFSKIYRYFWRFSTTGKAASKLHLGVSMQLVIHTKFPFSRLEQYGYCIRLLSFVTGRGES